MRNRSQTLITPETALSTRAMVRAAAVLGSETPDRTFIRERIEGTFRKTSHSAAATASMKRGGYVKMSCSMLP